MSETDLFLYILLFISILCVIFFLAMKIFKKESPVWARTSNTTDEAMNIVAKTSNEDAEESIMKNKAEQKQEANVFNQMNKDKVRKSDLLYFEDVGSIL